MTGSLSQTRGRPEPGMRNELLHFSAKPMSKVRSVEQSAEPSHKPDGLWVSSGPEWAEWCLAEEFGAERLRVVSRVVLADDANILRLSSCWDLDAFTEHFGARLDEDHYRHDIAWRRVAEQCDGIIIAPYQWERRHKLMWYYGWDVASGCIWNARAIASIESVDLAARSLSPADDGGAR